MKKNVFLTMLATLALASSAQVGDITTQWCKLLDAKAPDMGIDMMQAGGSLYSLAVTGTVVGDGASGWDHGYTDPTATICYDGQTIATGAAYEGSGYNNNLTLLKTDLHGNLQWCLYSTSGDVASNNGGIASAPDGGVYVSFVARHTDNLRTQPIRLVDATGQEALIDWQLDSPEVKRWWQGVLMKVSEAGAIEWLRLIEVSHAPQPSGSGDNIDHTGSAFYIYGMESDTDGNFYLTGRYANPITLLGADDVITLTPHNTDGWDGDAQKTRGDLYVIKCDNNGYVTGTLTTTGVANCESSSTMAKAGNDLIVNFMVTGATASGSTIGLDGHEISIPSSQMSMVTARLDHDLHVQWVQLFEGNECGGRGSVMQSNHINVVGDTMWLTGMGNFTLSNEDDTQSIATTSGNIREGYVIKCDATTGKWLKAACSKTGVLAGLNGICGYMGGFEDEDGNFYAYGYTYASRIIETDDDIEVEGYGIILVQYDTETLESTDFCSLISNGSMSTAQEFVLKDNVMYTLSRGRDADDEQYALKPINSDLRIRTQNWATVLASFKLPFTVKHDTNPATSGDVNGDGTVDVADVNQVINVMLGKGSLTPDPSPEGEGRCDVTGDGNVDVSDVNAVINIMLGKNRL
ncbi:MAG: dockerin type I repeat-containing protein [Muribaculaceae bacterium]|nr:dockerin type I repeat-containing protein [Muribaculaceae bacterium]